MMRALALLASITLVYAVPLTLLENSTISGAVCNDGTPGGYWFQAASNVANSDKWVIYMEGGGLCFTTETCETRVNSTLTSSDYFPTNLDASILVPQSGEQSTWNRVYIPYCSSDLYSGQNAGNEGPILGFTFNGHLILQEVVADLKVKHQLNQATDIILWGDGAGGVGVLYNINWLGLQVPNSDLAGVVNGGFYLSLPTWQNLTPTLAQIAPLLIQLWNPYIEPRCTAAGINSTYCLNSISLYPSIAYDLFIAQSMIDTFEIFGQLGAPISLSTPGLPQFIAQVNAGYKSGLSVFQTKDDDAWYLLTCLVNTINATTTPLNGTSVVQAVTQWYDGDDSVYADYCDVTSVFGLLVGGVSGNDCTTIASRCTKTQYALDPLPITSSSSSGSISSSSRSSTSGSVSSTSTSTPTSASATTSRTSAPSDASQTVAVMAVVLAVALVF